MGGQGLVDGHGLRDQRVGIAGPAGDDLLAQLPVVRRQGGIGNRGLHPGRGELAVLAFAAIGGGDEERGDSFPPQRGRLPRNRVAERCDGDPHAADVGTGEADPQDPVGGGG